MFCARSFGGDINKCGITSCASFLGCYPACTCMKYYHVAVPAGVMSKEGVMVTYTTESTIPSRWSGMGAPI